MEPRPCNACGGAHAPGPCPGSQNETPEHLRLPGAPVELPLLRSYEQALGLQWPITYSIDYSGKLDRLRVLSFSREHAIQLTLNSYIEPEKNKDMMVHELCHAALAERIDPAFASALFLKKYRELKGEEEKKFSQATREFYLAWCHIDLWVDALRDSLWPELTQQGHKSFVQAMQGLARAGERDAFRQPDNIIAMALNSLEGKKYGFPPFNIKKALGKETGEEVARPVRLLSQYYESLPPLSYNREEDLALLQRSVQGAAAVLKRVGILPKLIQPTIQAEEGRYVWSLD